MSKKIRCVFALLVTLVSGYVIVQYFILDGYQAGFIQMKLIYFSKLSSFWYYMLFIHVTAGLVTLAIGPFSLSHKFREKNIKRHRWLGTIYMLGIFIGSVSGLYLAFYANGGWIGKVGLGILSVLWLLFAFIALVKVKNQNILDHQKWMIRNYSLTFAAVTLRIWLGIFIFLFGIEQFEISYAIIAWLSWIPNLILAELYVRNFIEKRQRQEELKLQQ